jgi:hypothetical protein
MTGGISNGSERLCAGQAWTENGAEVDRATGTKSGAEERARTSTPFREQAPEACASASSATSAGRGDHVGRTPKYKRNLRPRRAPAESKLLDCRQYTHLARLRPRPRTRCTPTLLHAAGRTLPHPSHRRTRAPRTLDGRRLASARSGCAAVLALATEPSIIPALPPAPRIQLAAGLLQCIIVRGRDA